MDRARKKWTRLLIPTCCFFIIGLISLAFWNIFLVDEIKKSEIEREELKEDMKKIEILEKVNRNFIKDVLRQKAIVLCFMELIEEHKKKYRAKDIQDCTQFIVMTDEKYGHKGLDAPLILAWLEKESGGNPQIVSQVGAKGLTQWMDYRAWKILAAMGYPGYDRELVFNPVVNLAGGIYYLNGLINFWEWKGIEDQMLVLFYTLRSYKCGSVSTEELYNTQEKGGVPNYPYANWIIKRRKYWADKLKYWIDDAQKIAEKWEKTNPS